jgi:hypothetical protein
MNQPVSLFDDLASAADDARQSLGAITPTCTRTCTDVTRANRTVLGIIFHNAC